jgi:hypothetical protein
MLFFVIKSDSLNGKIVPIFSIIPIVIFWLQLVAAKCDKNKENDMKQGKQVRFREKNKKYSPFSEVMFCQGGLNPTSLVNVATNMQEHKE